MYRKEIEIDELTKFIRKILKPYLLKGVRPSGEQTGETNEEEKTKILNYFKEEGEFRFIVIDYRGVLLFETTNEEIVHLLLDTVETGKLLRRDGSIWPSLNIKYEPKTSNNFTALNPEYLIPVLELIKILKRIRKKTKDRNTNVRIYVSRDDSDSSLPSRPVKFEFKYIGISIYIAPIEEDY